MIKTYLMTIVVALGLFSFFIFSFIKTNEYVFQEEVAKSTDIALKEALELLAKEEDFALSLSILISQNNDIIKALKETNRELAYKEISKLINLLRMFSQRDAIDIQIHNDKMETFLRSWDFSIYGVPLQDFRKGVQKVQQTRRPTVSVELGKRLNIKAISPILESGHMLGSIEVIVDFDNIERELQKKGVTLIVLLDKKYLDIATKHRDQERFGRYVLITNSCSIYCKDMIDSFLAQDLSSGVFYNDDFSIGFYPLKDFGGRKLGLIGVFFPISAIESKYILFKEFM